MIVEASNCLYGVVVKTGDDCFGNQSKLARFIALKRFCSLCKTGTSTDSDAVQLECHAVLIPSQAQVS